jgi:uncharacterized protein YkwD
VGRTQHFLLYTMYVCIAALLPSFAFADERPSDKPNTIFLPLTLQAHNGTTLVSSNSPAPIPEPETPLEPTPTPPAVELTSLEAEVVRLTNEVRAQHNCPALNVSSELTLAARAHSQDMADHDFFSHTGSNGSQPWERMKAAGYTWMKAGENIQAGSNVAQEVVNIWMNSADHRANILNCEYKDIGIGFVDDQHDVYDDPRWPYRYYWTQDFGTRP